MAFDNTIKQTAIETITQNYSDFMETTNKAEIDSNTTLTPSQKTQAKQDIEDNPLVEQEKYTKQVEEIINKVYEDIKTENTTKGYIIYDKPTGGVVLAGAIVSFTFEPTKVYIQYD